MGENDVAAKSEKAISHLLASGILKGITSAMLYWPIRNELDVKPVIHGLWGESVLVYMPRCRPKEPGTMDLASVSCLDDLSPGKYGIMEPDPDACPAVNAARPDVVLVPGVAFDRRGFRIGFGGGYYDRLLQDVAFAETAFVGMGYDFQLVYRIPEDNWDIPVDALCTDKEFVWAFRE